MNKSKPKTHQELFGDFADYLKGRVQVLKLGG